MALRVELKPDERFILGPCFVTNGPHRNRLFVEATRRSYAKKVS